MTFVITEACIDIKDGSCTAVCPVECIYEGGRMFYIHPDECVSCGLCESICPVDAIRSVAHLPPELAAYKEVNRDFFGPGVTGWGSPQGWDADYTTDLDHPLVAAYPQRAAAEA
jgi:NAD-dependent dihydropyrimidine dehydrogenase PreA subunit